MRYKFQQTSLRCDGTFLLVKLQAQVCNFAKKSANSEAVTGCSQSKTGAINNLENFTGKHLLSESLFNKVSGLQLY